MNIIKENRIQTNISLGHTQMYVLAKLIASETKLMAYEAVSLGRNVLAARDQLTGINLMDFTDDKRNPQTNEKSAWITDQGVEVMKEEGLVDDMGQLTDQGNQYAFAENPEDIETIAAQNAKAPLPTSATPDMKTPSPMGDGQGTQGMGAMDIAGGEAPMESWSMIADMNDALNEKEFFKKNKEIINL